MGNIVGKQFGVVASKNVADSLAESVKEGNQAKFYLAQAGPDANGIALDNVTKVTDVDRNVLIINGNTIQGINKKDIDKLDAISDATKIFKYKGSVNTKEQLLEKTPSSEVGDVYNVEVSIELNNIYYPAHTNFVYTGSSSTGDNEKYWDSLGGTMQIGTSAKISKISDGEVHWEAGNKMPISSLNLKVSTDNGLGIDGNGKIYLDVGTSITTVSGDANILYLHNTQNHPLYGVDIAIGAGLAISTSGDSSICLKLSTGGTEEGGLSSYSGAGKSGLDIRGGGLYIALSSSEVINKKLLVLNDDGLAVNYKELISAIAQDIRIRSYINSLIDAKLKAQ